MSAAECQRRSAAFLRQEFIEMYGRVPRIFRAPGRVNLIGEHTDYNDGFVMPAGICFSTLVAAASRHDRRLRVYSDKFEDSREWDLGSIKPGASGHWSDYVRGVAGVMQARRLELSGADLVVHSDVPMGAGLSSSAALEIATALALLCTSGLEIDRTEMALICQQAEHEYAGARCGIMDQFVCANGRAGHALLLDCRSLAFEYLRIPPGVRVAICDSRVKHAVSGGEYNERRASCEAGVAHLAKGRPDLRSLRDVTAEELEQNKAGLDEVTYRRCRHVVGEIARTLRAADKLREGDLVSFGQLMRESHQSLRDDYQVSCRELDILVEIAEGVEGVFGARMTGAGFGGCTVNLVKESAIAEFQLKVAAGYRRAVGTEPLIYVSEAADGAGECVLEPQKC